VLDLMRKHARSWLIKIALGGIIIVFIFFFGWGGPTERQQNYVAKVNDTVISDEQFYAVYESELEKLRLRFKGTVPADLVEKLNLKKTIVQDMVSRIVLVQEAQRLGLFVTDEDLVREIRTNPMFQRDGAFDEGLYRAYLNAIKLSSAAFETSRRQDLLAQQVARLLTDAVKTDPEEINRLWHFQNDKLALEILVIKPEELKEAADPKALEAYFKKNQAKYEIPASLNLQYVVFSWRDAQKGLSIPEQEVFAYYQSHPKEFLLPEKIRARHILLKVPEGASKEQIEETRKKGEAILARINSGEEFEKVAEQESQDEATAKNGGDLGFFSRGAMDPELEKAAFKLGRGKVSDVILTRQGFDIIRVDDGTPEVEIPFESVKDKIEAKLLEEKARKKVNDEAENFYEQVYRAEDLEAPAKKFGFEIHKAERVSRTAGIPELAEDPKIMDEAFQLRTGEVSNLLRSGDKFVVIKLVDKVKERLPGLEEVQSTVEKDFLQEQALKAATKKADEIIAAIQKQPHDIEGVSKQFQIKWTKLDPVSRTTGFVAQLGSGPQVTEMLTSVTPAAPLFPTPITVPDGVAVARLISVEKASDEQYAKDAPVFEKWVLEVRQTDFLKGWLRLLEDRSKISIREKL
jgi:peptidyl-prolyl cis-trans isomerase D